MRFALAALFLYGLYKFLRSRPSEESVSVASIAAVEARLRLGEPLPEVNEEELRRIKRTWETKRGSRGKVAPFLRSDKLWRTRRGA